MKRSIYLVVGASDIPRLVSSLRDALSGSSGILLVDRLEIQKWKSKEQVKTQIAVGDDRLELVDSGELLIQMNRDDLEYAVEKLSEALRCGYFEPAELTRVRIGPSNDFNDVYCEIVG